MPLDRLTIGANLVSVAAAVTFLIVVLSGHLSVPLAVGISGLEIIVVLVQAYVFTLLTAVFIGMAIHVHH